MLGSLGCIRRRCHFGNQNCRSFTSRVERRSSVHGPPPVGPPRMEVRRSTGRSLANIFIDGGGTAATTGGIEHSLCPLWPKVQNLFTLRSRATEDGKSRVQSRGAAACWQGLDCRGSRHS